MSHITTKTEAPPKLTPAQQAMREELSGLIPREDTEVADAVDRLMRQSAESVMNEACEPDGDHMRAGHEKDDHCRACHMGRGWNLNVDDQKARFRNFFG